MKTRALGFLLMAIGACTYAIGCSSSSNNGGTGGAGGGGTGGMGTGGKATGGNGAGGSGMGGKMDGGMDAPGDMAGDTQQAPTFTQVFAIISDKSTATSPGCTTCHDGVIPDGGNPSALPHGLNFTDKTAAFNALVNVDSIRCAGSDAGADASAALKRVLPNNAAMSVLWQKVNQGVNGPSMPACDDVGMPINRPIPNDGGATDGGDAGFTTTTYMVTAQQLATIQGWINAGAQDN